MCSILVIAFAPTLSEVPHLRLVVAVLGLSLAAQIGVMVALRSTASRQFVLIIHDLVLAVGVSLLIPEIWAACVCAAAITIVWAALIVTPGRLTVLGIGTAAGLAGAGSVGHSPHWVPVLGIAFITAGGFAQSALTHGASQNSIQSRLSEAMAVSGFALYDCDLGSGRVRAVTGPIDEMTGWSSLEWMSMDHRTLIHPDDLGEYWIQASSATGDEVHDRTARFRRRDGSWIWLRDVSRSFVGKDGAVGLSGFVIDVTPLSEALAAAEYRGTHDQLTGLPNRVTLVEQLERRLAAGQHFGLLMLDLNRFKEVNDTLGHAIGDRLLVEFAARLRCLIGATESVTRLGGDEFAVVVDSADEAHLRRRADEIAAASRRPIVIGDVSLAASVSIGGVLSADDPIDASTLMRWADVAMYDAKRRGRHYTQFRTDLESTSVIDLFLSAAIPAALAAGEIIAHFQPKVAFDSKEIIGYEALARWEHPEHGLLGAAKFTHLIQVSDYMAAFTDRMIDQALDAIVAFAERGTETTIAVNISARSLMDIEFPHRVATICEAHRVSPTRLIFELTEHELMEATSVSLEIIDRLHELGVAFSIDDFGTGYSSFSRLPDLPIDEIKIDRSFLWAAERDERNSVIIASIIGLAHRLGHRVVAEGVESIGQLALLRDLGCDVGQGYLFSRPVPLGRLLSTAPSRR